MTCCAPHNVLLQVDGLTEPWAGELGQNDVAEMRSQAPFALRCVQDSELQNFGRHQNKVTNWQQQQINLEA